jgi:hypothetical protein
MIWPVFKPDVENLLLMFHLSSMSNGKKERSRKTYGLLQSEEAEYDPWVVISVDLKVPYINN